MAATQMMLLHRRPRPIPIIDLIATCQRHTRCSAAYCLRTQNGHQKCRFGYPKQLQPETTIVTADTEPELLTARNDGLINSFNPVQLSAWRANVDMQYCLSRHRVVEYCAKYATKSEPRSQPLKEVFTNIMRSLKDDNTSLKTVQKPGVWVRETTQLKKPAVCSSSYQCSEHPETSSCSASMDLVQWKIAWMKTSLQLSALDHYIGRPTTPQFNEMTLLHYVQQFTMPKQLGSNPSRRRKAVVVIVRPYFSPDPSGPKYEEYCRQSCRGMDVDPPSPPLMGSCTL